MGVQRTTILRVASVLAAAVALSAVLPFTGAAADREEVSFRVGFSFPGNSSIQPTITELGDRVVRVEDVAYFGVGSRESLGDEAGAHLSWLVNLEQMRGTVWGSVTMTNPVLELHWQGELRGHVTPAGGEGTLHLTELSTGQRFSGRWELNHFVDPTASEQGFSIFVSGTVTSA